MSNNEDKNILHNLLSTKFEFDIIDNKIPCANKEDECINNIKCEKNNDKEAINGKEDDKVEEKEEDKVEEKEEDKVKEKEEDKVKEKINKDIEGNKDNSDYCLYLGPGAFKGYAELGFLLSLEKHLYLSKFNNIRGCSIGSIIGLFLTLSIPMLDIINYSLEINSSFNLTNFKPNITNSTISLFSLETIKKKITEIVEETCYMIPTFQTLYMYTGIEFSVVVYNLTDMKVEIFDRISQPNMSCIDAVIISSSIPPFFPSVDYMNKCYVDGVIGDSYYIDDFYDKGKKILCIYIEDVCKSLGINMLLNIFKTTSSSFFEMAKLKRKIFKNNCEHIWIRVQNIDIVSEINNLDVINNMIIKGYVIGEEFILSKDIFKNVIISIDDKDDDNIIKKLDIDGEIYYEENSFSIISDNVTNNKKTENVNIEQIKPEDLHSIKINNEILQNKAQQLNELFETPKTIRIPVSTRIQNILNSSRNYINTNL